MPVKRDMGHLEGKNNVKRAKRHALVQEDELYRPYLGHWPERKTSDIDHRWTDSNGGPCKLDPTDCMS